MKLRLMLCLTLCAPIAVHADGGWHFGRFGEVAVYRPAATASDVVVMVSGLDGWTADDAVLARALAAGGAVVVGVDLARYAGALNSPARPCLYPAGDFEALSQALQKHLALTRYTIPVLVGRDAGAAWAYAALAQSPANTFRGAIGLDFDPATPLPRPGCRGYGLEHALAAGGRGYVSLPRADLPAPWVAINTKRCRPCAEAAGFVANARPARLERLDLPGAPPAAAAVRQAALLRVVTGLRPAAATGAASLLPDLPLIEVAATGAPHDTLAIIISGDGGWAGIDRDLATALAARGYPVLGLNSLQYFWRRRSPDETGRDLERMITRYLAAWHKHRVILIGYSRGAEVLPFMVNRLSPAARAPVRLVALLGPGPSVDFEFRVTDWLGAASPGQALPTRPEALRLHGTPLLCVYGREETDSLCPQLPAGLGQVQALGGGHHFGGDYAALADLVLGAAGPAGPGPVGVGKTAPGP